VCPHARCVVAACFCFVGPRPRSAPLFPYTTLFRSGLVRRALLGHELVESVCHVPGSWPPAPGRGPRHAARCRRGGGSSPDRRPRSEEHTSELQSRENLVCRLLLEKKKRMLR